MTVSLASNVTTAVGDGSTDPVPIPFFFLEDGDIEVTVRTDATGAETTWVLNTDYTLTGAGVEAGGELMPITTRATGTTMFIRRVEQFTQGTDFPAAGAIPSNTIEQALDRLTFLCQQLNETFARSLTVPVTDAASSLVLPSNINRASKFLAFDASGNPIASVGSSDGLGPVTPFVSTILDDSTAAEVIATLLWLVTAHEWTKTQNFNATILTDGANIAWDLESNQVCSVTLAGNRTLDNPTNMKDGATYVLTVKQDATGSRTLAYGANYKWSGGAAPVLSTGANAVDILTFVSDGTNMYGSMVADFS